MPATPISPDSTSGQPCTAANVLTGESSAVPRPVRVLDLRLLRGQLARAAGEAKHWLWEGYVAAGMVSLLTSQWKSGKSTLISLLAARMETGGELAGSPVGAGRVAIISEEGPGIWDERANQLDLGGHISYFCQPFRAKPTMENWEELLDAMLELRACEGLDLVVIDTLATFLPGNNENTAGVMMNCLLPLRALTSKGVGVLLVHHPRKGVYQPGQAARGSGALPGYVDILLEMAGLVRRTTTATADAGCGAFPGIARHAGT
jgi:hypothetical protein